MQGTFCFRQVLGKKISIILVNCPYLTAPPYFAEGEKNFGVFSSKRPLFSIGKKEAGLLPPPLFFKILVGRGRGQLTGITLMLVATFFRNFLKFFKNVIFGRKSWFSSIFLSKKLKKNKIEIKVFLREKDKV